MLGTFCYAKKKQEKEVPIIPQQTDIQTQYSTHHNTSFNAVAREDTASRIRKSRGE